MAAKGYVVLYPNPRGSTSYGQEFGNVIQYRYPGDDAKDLLAGVDELVRRGLADPDRLGVTGGSGGGVLTNWIITQTDRFKAAASQRSIADWSGFWYTADFTLFQPTWFKGAPWEDPQDFAARSPITHVTKIRTPLMLIEGESDHRTPPAAGGEEMFRALKYLKRPVVMVRFPGETPRPLPLRQALAPHRAAAAHRGLVRQVPAGQGDDPLRRAGATAGDRQGRIVDARTRGSAGRQARGPWRRPGKAGRRPPGSSGRRSCCA